MDSFAAMTKQGKWVGRWRNCLALQPMKWQKKTTLFWKDAKNAPFLQNVKTPVILQHRSHSICSFLSSFPSPAFWFMIWQSAHISSKPDHIVQSQLTTWRLIWTHALNNLAPADGSQQFALVCLFLCKEECVWVPASEVHISSFIKVPLDLRPHSHASVCLLWPENSDLNWECVQHTRRIPVFWKENTGCVIHAKF